MSEKKSVQMTRADWWWVGSFVLFLLFGLWCCEQNQKRVENKRELYENSSIPNFYKGERVQVSKGSRVVAFKHSNELFAYNVRIGEKEAIEEARALEKRMRERGDSRRFAALEQGAVVDVREWSGMRAVKVSFDCGEWWVDDFVLEKCKRAK